MPQLFPTIGGEEKNPVARPPAAVMMGAKIMRARSVLE
jgi:hypothetical protein